MQEPVRLDIAFDRFIPMQFPRLPAMVENIRRSHGSETEAMAAVALSEQANAQFLALLRSGSIVVFATMPDGTVPLPIPTEIWCKQWYPELAFMDGKLDGWLSKFPAPYDARIPMVDWAAILRALDPKTATDWTLSMALAWISWRTTGDVCRYWPRYREAVEVEPAHPYFFSMLNDELAESDNSNPPRIKIDDAKADLWLKLRDGLLDMTAMQEREIVVVPSHAFSDIEVPEYEGNADVLRLRAEQSRPHMPRPAVYSRLHLRSTDLLRLWPTEQGGSNHNGAAGHGDEGKAIRRGESAKLHAAAAKAFPNGIPPELPAGERRTRMSKYIDGKVPAAKTFRRHGF